MIRYENVTKIIKGQKVIDHVSLSIKRGMVTGFQGVNGSGKTMLMRLACGLIHPTEGAVYINGNRLGTDMEFPSSLGLLIEGPAFLGNYSGYDNLMLLAELSGKADSAKIREAILRVGLDPDDKKKYRKYSLGMKQRLGIANAIMEGCDLIVLDEPTNALDSDGVEMLKQIVHEEKERGATILISCHDARILQEMSDVIHRMENGNIIGDGHCCGLPNVGCLGSRFENGEN